MNPNEGIIKYALSEKPLMKTVEKSFIPTYIIYFTKFRTFVALCVYLVGAFGLQYYLHNVSTSYTNKNEHDFWFVTLLLNLVGYGLVLLPIWLFENLAVGLLQFWAPSSNKFSTLARKCLIICFTNHPSKTRSPYLPQFVDDGAPKQSWKVQLSIWLEEFCQRHNWFAIVLYTLSLNLIYVVWGVLQERLMTTDYGGQRFSHPQFLVFFNRIGALVVSSVCIMMWRGSDTVQSNPKEIPAFSCYALPALSNIVSSWCQYEALVFVTFPVQVISKACKIIPVMLMGKILHKRSYEMYEYVVAGFISLGVTIFILSSHQKPAEKLHGVDTGVFNVCSGLALIVGYMFLDSFTSTSQDNLFRTHKMSAIKMMLGSSCWAISFTLVPLLVQGSLVGSLHLCWNQPVFLCDVILSACCSGLGQILIFKTISRFGAVTFVIIMTIRQTISIIISCVVFIHPINAVGLLGFFFTFGAIFARIFIRQRKRREQQIKSSS